MPYCALRRVKVFLYASTSFQILMAAWMQFCLSSSSAGRSSVNLKWPLLRKDCSTKITKVQ